MSLSETILARLRQHGVEAHDIRAALPRRGAYPRTPDLGRLVYTAIHYSAASREVTTLAGDIVSWRGHADWHVNHHVWPAVAYAFGISPSGRVFLLRDVEEQGYHAYGASANALPVCVDSGPTSPPTAAALSSLRRLLVVLHEETPELPALTAAGTRGHRELGFLDARNATTPCPGTPLLTWVQQYRDGRLDAYARPAPEDNVETLPTGITMRRDFGFYQYWSAHGGVEEFGYPIRDEETEGGLTVQYFERARLELHPDGVIRRGLVGAELLAARWVADELREELRRVKAALAKAEAPRRTKGVAGGLQ